MKFSEVMKYYFQICWKFKKYYIPTIVLAVVAATLSASTPFVFKFVVDSVVDKNFDRAQILILIFVAFVAFAEIFAGIAWRFGDYLMVATQKEGVMRYVDALQRMDFGFHADKSSGSLIGKNKRGSSALFDLVETINMDGLWKLIGFIVAIAGTAFFNLKITFLLILLAIVTGFFQHFFIKMNIRRRKNVNKTEDNISAIVVDNMIGFQTVKSFGKEKYEYRRLDKSHDPWWKADLEYSMTFRYIDIVMGVFMVASSLIIMLLTLRFIKSGEFTVGDFAMMYGLSAALIEATWAIVWKSRTFVKSYTDLREYFEIMNLKSSVQDIKNPVSIHKLKGEINFEKVDFSYNDSEEKVLKGINLKIKPGETIALVGKSGGGKTTLTKLIMRFYDIDSGKILIDGTNVRDFAQNELRQHIGLVPQDPVLFNETIGYNIGYAREGIELSEIKKAAELAALDDFIESLPKKYDTMVGERGIKLSGGQRQRLAIARVILENSEIIIFDEATSQLDSENERKIQNAFGNLTKNKTTIIIAHRLSTIMNADRIVVVDKGEVKEIGTHNDLLRSDGIYKKLWSMQTDGVIN